MKEYKKPAMMALSLSADAALCSGCSTEGRESIKGNDSIKSILLSFLGVDMNNDGSLSQSEAEALFASSAEGCTNDVDIVGYCKFTGQDSIAIIWS